MGDVISLVFDIEQKRSGNILGHRVAKHASQQPENGLGLARKALIHGNAIQHHKASTLVKGRSQGLPVSSESHRRHWNGMDRLAGMLLKTGDRFLGGCQPTGRKRHRPARLFSNGLAGPGSTVEDRFSQHAFCGRGGQ